MSAMLPTMPPGYAATGAPNVTTQPTGRGRLFTLIFGVVAVSVTLTAILLAVIAPAFSAAPPSPGTWTKVVDADFNTQTSDVSTGPGCSLSSSGLDVIGGQNHHTACEVITGASGALANGFLLTATLAPDAQITSGSEQPYISLGQSAVVAVEQSSTDSIIIVCTHACDTDASNGQDVGSDAWHNDNYYANTLTLYWPGSGQHLVVYANGQQVASIAFAFEGNTALTLGAVAQGEALYTHLTVYTP